MVLTESVIDEGAGVLEANLDGDLEGFSRWTLRSMKARPYDFVPRCFFAGIGVDEDPQLAGLPAAKRRCRGPRGGRG
ncbi:MAG: hypothetical protein GEU68_15015 [Actinobacteria bacterium]|nr:hypothetical protein [Actinomycetota bacterium]